MTPMPERASLAKIMDEVEAMEKRIAEAVEDEFGFKVYTYRWRPRGVPDFPCIYNWLAPSPADRGAVQRVRDTFNINANCGVRWSDEEIEMGELESLADQFRLVCDKELQHTGTGLGGLPHKADRRSMQNAADRFNEVPVLVLQFPLMIDVDRIIE